MTGSCCHCTWLLHQTRSQPAAVFAAACPCETPGGGLLEPRRCVSQLEQSTVVLQWHEVPSATAENVWTHRRIYTGNNPWVVVEESRRLYLNTILKTYKWFGSWLLLSCLSHRFGRNRTLPKWQGRGDESCGLSAARVSTGSRTADTNEHFPSVKIYVAKPMGSQLCSPSHSETTLTTELLHIAAI